MCGLDHDLETNRLRAAHRLFESGHAYYCDMTSDEIQERAKAEGVTGYAGWSRDRDLGPAAGSEEIPAVDHRCGEIPMIDP